MPAARSAVTSSFTPRYIPWNITKLTPPQMAGETLEVRGDRRRGLGFHGAEVAEQPLAEGRDPRAAAPAAADRRLDHRRAEIAVQRLCQLPGTPVRHAHGARRSRDRTRLADARDELRLAGTEGGGALAEHAQRQARIAGHSAAGVGKGELPAVDAIVRD